MNLLDVISTSRSQRGVSQADLAAELGIARLAVTRLESGVGAVSLLLAVMKALELRLSGIGLGDTLPEQLRARRERLGLSIARVAEKTGIDARTLRAVERGEGTINSLIPLLETIAPKWKKSEPARASWNYDPRGLAERDQRFTPGWFLDHVQTAFGDIDLDPCAHPESSVEARRKIVLPECGLTSSWSGTRLAYVNPPFSAVAAWMARAADAWDRGEVEKMVLLAPVRTDSDVFQRRVSRDAETLFLARRMRFESPTGLAWPAPFSLMVNVWGSSEDRIRHFVSLSPAVRMRPYGHDNQIPQGLD